jgi:iron(III) transport system permease protein
MSGLSNTDIGFTASGKTDAIKSERGIIKGQRTALFVLAALIPALVVLLMGTIIWIILAANGADSFGAFGLQNFSRAFFDDFAVTAIGNTVGFTLVALVVAFAFGTSIAWLTERTDIGGKRIIYGTMLLGLVIPTFFMAMGWILFAHPRIGVLNRFAQAWWGPDTVVVNISSIGGMGFVEGLALAPHVFVMTSGALRLMNPVLEEAGAIHGLGSVQILRRITIPLLLPALAAAAIYIAVIAASAFDVPAVIGLAARIYTFSTMIYVTALSPDRAPQYGIPAAVGVVMSVIGVVLTFWYLRLLHSAEKFHVVSGKAYLPSLVSPRYGRWMEWALIGTFVVLSFVIPLLLVIWASLQPFLSVPSVAALGRVSLSQFRGIDWSLMARGGFNTAILFFVVPTVALAFSIPIAWVITRSRSRLRYVYEVLVFLPHAVPKIIFGVAALLLSLYVIDKVVPIYGTVWLIAIIYVVERITSPPAW